MSRINAIVIYAVILRLGRVVETVRQTVNSDRRPVSLTLVS